MPSVEMRRSTRVFVPKAKDGELVRVLRSGRRLWVESSEVKHKGSKNGDEWFPINPDGDKCKQQKINGWHGVNHPVHDPMDVDVAKPVPKISDGMLSLRGERKFGDCKMFRNVYSRKRKLLHARKSDFFSIDSESKKFGLHFVRRKRRRTGRIISAEQKSANDEIEGHIDHGLLSVIFESSCVGCSSNVLNTLLRYISKERIGLYELSASLLSSLISPLFASSGIHFLWNRSPMSGKGVCRIFGVRQFVVMFTVDFMAAPRCFLRLHSALFIRSVRLSSISLIDFNQKNDSTDEPLPYINDQSEITLSRLMAPFTDDGLVAPATDDAKDVKVVKSCNRICSRNVQSRVGVLTRSASKRRRRSLRSRRARNPLHLVLQKSSGSPVSNLIVPKKNGSALPVASKQELRRSVRKSSVNEIVQNSSSLASNVDISSQSSSTNILVVETDKCYRVEGAEVSLDTSASNESLLVVKKDGIIRYSFKVQREMRPGATNRFTHAVMWTGDNGWKLEFTDRKDWAVFKELYKLCAERNILPMSPAVKIIPVPGVCEVTNLWDSPCAFQRPESYIRMTSNELSRTFSRRTANYDMDSEDEEWLNKFNSELDASNHVSDESFELMIDAFEKASYCNPEVISDEETAASLCQDVASMYVAAPVYRYWTTKRKQKHAPLVRVFQLNQPAKAPLIMKPVLRKKRSLKRPTVLSIQQGRGKDCSVLQVIAAEHNAAEEQSAILRVQEAKASADKSVEFAILKRKRAQILMENADLAMYRATMALRIADAAAEFMDSEQAANHFLE